MKIIMTGASGLIGRALVPALTAAGHDVRRLVRRPPESHDEIAWDPTAGRLDPAALSGVEAVINLAGENIGRRWTRARRERILRSRVDVTRTLISAVARLVVKPAVWINASAVGFYGDRGNDVLTETSSIGHGFLPEVCLAWETHAEAAGRLGVRTVLARFGVVLAREEGALAKMLPLFRIGLGGRLGSGRQWMSWVSMDDVVDALRHALTDARCTGPINVTAPAPVTNAEFTATLARVIGRPAVLPAPAWALRLAFGTMADEALLWSMRAQPERLHACGFRFRRPELELALRALLDDGR